MGALRLLFQSAWRGRLLALAGAAVIWAVWWSLFPASLQQLDERATDLLWRATASPEPERRVILIDIDDASLGRVGPWPWPRQTLAELTRKLDEQGVGLKLFDAVFPEPREGTAALTSALAAHDATAPAVLAQVFALNNESQLQSGQLAGALAGAGCQSPGMLAQGFLANAPGLHPRAGHITPTLDADGAVRRVPALVCFEGRTYPALTLAGLMALAPPASGAAPRPLALQPGVGPWAPAWEATLSVLPGHTVGLDPQGQMRVPYRQARAAYTAVPAADLLQDKIAPGALKGAWVIIGASAFGLADVVPTALGKGVGGAEVHAQLLSALVDGAIPFTPRAAPWLQLAAVVLGIGLLVGLVVGNPLGNHRRVLLLPVASLVLAGLMAALHAVALLQAGWYVGWAGPALALVLAGAGLALAEHQRSLFQKARLYQNLSSYVPGPVAQKIAFTQPTGEIQAERLDVTILAADLNNFTAYCEARSPEETARVLHRFYSTASEIVAAHGGVVEEMVGDSLLAVFNGPQPCADHPQKALAAARDIWLRCSEELPNVTAQGLEPLGVSIGLDSGDALVGSFGTAARRVHTVLGQAVSVALRLRELTVDLAYPVLVGAQTASRVLPQGEDPVLVLKPLGSFLLPGMQHSAKVYTLRHLLQPGSAQEQRNLHYIHQVNIAA
jgi:adenylate cyclase